MLLPTPQPLTLSLLLPESAGTFWVKLLESTGACCWGLPVIPEEYPYFTWSGCPIGSTLEMAWTRWVLHP